jgi:hypothetical protein
VVVDPGAVARQDATLRPFLNHLFYYAVFDAKRFHDDHEHCLACWRTITALDRADVDHDGYVTLHEVQYTGFPVSVQYSWACKECFARYREAYGWQLSSGSAPEIPEETRRAFSVAYQEYLARKKQNQ